MKLTENVSRVYDHYYVYSEIKEILEEYTAKYPQYCDIESIGVTLEGRDILLLKVTNKETGDYEDKPAYYLQGNIHAGEVTGCMAVMYFLDTIFTNIDTEEIQRMLKKYTVYALPRVSPDGSEYYLTTPYTLRSVNTMYPYDEPMPGLYPEDIDKDGVIRKMRVKSPSGIWKVSDKDPRVMVRRKPDDDEGTFYHVYTEGLLREYDGMTIKEAPAEFGNDFNRNYPAGWETEETQRGAGEYPMSSVETKANAEFLMNHLNICTVIDMHTAGGQVLYTPAFKSANEIDPQDLSTIRKLAKIATEENGYPMLNIHDEYCDPKNANAKGCFGDFCHFVVGVPQIAIECWDLGRRSGVHENYPPIPLTDDEQEEDMYKYMKWIDENLNGEGYLTWTKFDHPQLGEVEIGGFDQKKVTQNCPIPFLTQELQKHTDFYLRGVRTLPHIEFEKVEKEEIADGVWKLSVVVGNTGFMPTYVFHEGLKNRKLKHVTVALEGAELVQGNAKEDIGHLGGYACTFGMNGTWGPNSMVKDPCEKKVTWVIKAAKGTAVKVTVSGGRIGRKETEITL